MSAQTTVGLTYDLKDDYRDSGLDPEIIAEFDSPETVDGIESALRYLGCRVVRIGHIQNLVQRLAAGERWDLVFNICEGLHGIAREAQVPALLEAYGIPCTFSDAAGMALMLDKGLTKLVLQNHGIPTAPFAVVRTTEDVAAVKLPFPLFAKPLAEGTGKGINAFSYIDTPDHLERACDHLLQKFQQPVLVETYLGGREFTVGMLGTGNRTRIIGIMEIAIHENGCANHYGYNNKTAWFDHIQYKLVQRHEETSLYKAIENMAIKTWQALDCRDAGRLDIRCDCAGNPFILEINPLAGLCPGFSDLVVLAGKAGMPYNALIRNIVAETAHRYNLKLPDQCYEAA
ncbi:MAG: D-alanine--D-alanine ligase [Micavibrio aeruginosavorus]|uniref:D-alanine--D-alanine ligase n=1 Tax=Micavibrio aeruginosavorus TaxID=349221 RepID=A0A7T5R2Q7_9BACT|nr:MAG: D-alanine--D-alanine ligase [Micavibrio aeruginosavorus]